jgi:hypothetical protein
MNKLTVIQEIINKKNAKNYLEIGIYKGGNFLPIKCNTKIAVDPNPVIPIEKKLKWYTLNPGNFSGKYFKTTSDNFFASNTALLKEKPIDVAFVDGLHTYQQSLKDVLNILKFADENAVVLMHDCNPETEASAYPSDTFEYAKTAGIKDWKGQWCGDVWKAVVDLRVNRTDLDVCVLNCDYGLGVVTRKKKERNFAPLNLGGRTIDSLSYPDLEKNRKEYLNLKEPEYFYQFLKTI